MPIELGPATVPELERRWRELKRGAFEAIAEARKRLDRNWPYHPEDAEAQSKAIEEARQFLRDLANEARNLGKERGRRPKAETNRRMIEALKTLQRPDGKQLGATKDAVSSDVAGPLDKVAKTLRTELRRFCLRVYETRQHALIAEELFEVCGFPRQEWPLVMKAYSIGKYFADRERRRHPERFSSIEVYKASQI